MPLNLSNPVVETKTIDKIEVTGQNFDMENMIVTLHYMTFLNDGTPYQRNRIMLEGADMLAKFAEVNAKLEQQEAIDVHQAIKEVNFETIQSMTGFTGTIE